MAETKLKPCPFCGEKAELQQFSSVYNLGYYVVCNTKDCQGNTEPENPYRRKDYAIRAWNTRTENIVHCKDCEFSGNCSIEEFGCYEPNDYCSKGKRKEL